MDITNNTSSTSSSSSWDLDIPFPMVIPNHSHPPFFHQFPLSNYDNFALNPNLHHQHHQLLPPSTSFPSTTHLELTHEELCLEDENQEEEGQLGAMKEMMYKIAAMQPVDIDPSTIKKPKRRNVRISDDPQSIAARHRRERISERIRILQRLVPGGTKMDTASMLDEAIRYVKFLKRQVQELQATSPPDVGPLDYIAQGLVPSSSTTTSNMGGQLGLGFGFGGQGFSDRMG